VKKGYNGTIGRRGTAGLFDTGGIPLKLLFDLHTHTVASGHAYSTLKENAEAAKERGLIALGTSDHASAMPGGPAPVFFTTYRAIPETLLGIRIFTGVEADILNFDGELDLPADILERMDYVIASLHPPCIQAGTPEENTRAVVRAMANPCVTILGHPDDDRYPLLYEPVVEAAARFHVALEVNSSSLAPRSARRNAEANMRKYLSLCALHRVPVIVNSDAHMYTEVGDFARAEQLLAACAFPEELVLNTQEEGLQCVIRDSDRQQMFRKGRP